MKHPVFREEYMRELARAEARERTKTPAKKKSRPWLVWAGLALLLGYSLYMAAGIIDIELKVLAELDFLFAAAMLTAIFVWSLRKG